FEIWIVEKLKQSPGDGIVLAIVVTRSSLPRERLRRVELTEQIAIELIGVGGPYRGMM
ncbi:hypothetical protein PC128_g17161, partial [Phytophthora cactorum]